MTQGYVLHMPMNRRSLFENHAEDKRDFGEPLPVFSYNRNFPYLVLISTNRSTLTHIASGVGSITAGSGMRRMNLKNILEIDIEMEEIVSHAMPKFKKLIEDIWDKGGIVPEKTFAEILRCLYIVYPDIEQEIRPYLSRTYSFKRLNQKVIQSLADQKEAVSTAMQLAELDRSPLQTWGTDGNESPRSFLEGLDEVYLREDSMIAHDMSVLPGFDIIRQSRYGRAQFRSANDQVILDVIVANRTAMEEQTGADLIYFNESYRSFVFIQYKAMEKETGIGDVFRLPNKQLTKEIESMRKLLKHLGDNRATHRDHYRISYNPFYIKLCSRIDFNPDDLKLTSGMYFNLDHWEFLENDADMLGPQGGRRISYKNMSRHITNTDFTTLVKHSWIGTTPKQTELIEPLIEEILRTGKSVIYAVKRDWSTISHEFKKEFNGFHSNEEELPF